MAGSEFATTGCTGPKETLRLLVVGQGCAPTGFSRVIHSILNHLPAGYEVSHFATNLKSPPPSSGNWKIFPNEMEEAQGLGELVDRLAPDLVFLVDVVWAVARFRALWEVPGRSYRVVLYLAAGEKEELTAKGMAQLVGADRLVFYTAFARDLARAALAELAPHCQGCGFSEIEVVPHGIDPKTFFPIAGRDQQGLVSSRKKARRKIFPGDPSLQDQFIVLNANRNQVFKRIDVCLRGFARFAKGKSDVRLYLHMATAKLAPGEIALVDELGLRDRVMISTTGHQHPDFSDERLNLLYNACDVGINTSELEGWGLVAFEHAATGAAQIVPGHGVCASLWNGAALQLATEDETRVEGYRVEGKTATIESIAGSLELLYRQDEVRRNYAWAGYLHATRSTLLWSNVAREWDRIFREVVELSRTE